jgi:tubulin polyglutamylase TTLL5
MYFKLVKCETKLVRAVLENNAWQGTETHDWNLLWSSQPYKSYIYDNMSDYQKVNHFPHSDELTRKDRLCVNIVRMQEKHGKEAFDIIPDTYNLPDEFADFYQHFHSTKQKIEAGSVRRDGNQWIIKPVNSCQGRGIFIVDEISEVPIDEPLIASRYLPNPLLINGLKSDIRLYVLVTCMDPWRVYIYNEGLVRFASEEYDASNIKTNKYAHLTNYSINKKNEKYVPNNNAEQGDEGHKWSLTALSKHLEQLGVDMELLWSKIYDVVIKSLISVDGHVQAQLRKTAQNRGTNANCFELLGFDIMLDQNLKPWLLEVNISPSLACDSPLDLRIKHGLFIDTLNLACLRRFDRRRENLNKMKQRSKNISRAKAQQARQATSAAAATAQRVSDALSAGGGMASGQHGAQVSL